MPKAIYAIASSKNPINVTTAVPKCGFPKYDKIPKYINVNNSHIITTITAEINFPKTIDVILLGEVYNSCSVPFFLSSENILIVNIGTINVNIVEAE